MNNNNILTSWFNWHFYGASNFLLGVWRNFILFSLNFFSTPLLLKTLFAPWRKYNWGYPRGFDIQQYAEVFISNFFSRLIGAICRIFLIIFGIIFQAFVLVSGAIIFLAWLVLPFLVLGGLLFSLSII